MSPLVSRLKVKIFADGADIGGIKEMQANPLIKGFTTNPTLMRKAGVTDYKAFALSVLDLVRDKPVSFEVFADDLPTMEAQALEIAGWGANVNVKIPITNTKGESTAPLVGRLSARGVQVNVTAMFTLQHVRDIVAALDAKTPAILSIFAGRIADTGVDPMPLMREAVAIAKAKPKSEVLWASPREVLNIFHSDEVGCHIITVTNDLIKKLEGAGKDLDLFSLETVEMFYRDAKAANYVIETVG
ncbi:transaldolase [Ferrovibrio sp.]|uniref:transaldolase n=1 Tax=Ferrovibrio sp. TaxID=1917215 RepID=UPI0025C15304|nr:transaldolase [Ferrovibrio sp.]MBX3454248.1 transaldolase [Ferrovibrio sp.]